MTQMIMMKYDFISENPFNQCHQQPATYVGFYFIFIRE